MNEKTMKKNLILTLVLGNQSGWWIRVTGYDEIFYMSKSEAIKQLENILALPDGYLNEV
jgi:hypothetical protein